MFLVKYVLLFIYLFLMQSQKQRIRDKVNPHHVHPFDAIPVDFYFLFFLVESENPGTSCIQQTRLLYRRCYRARHPSKPRRSEKVKWVSDAEAI